MGGSPKPKKESQTERTARLLGAKKSATDARALALDAQMLKSSKRRSSLFGGPESGGSSLGSASMKLGMY